MGSLLSNSGFCIDPHSPVASSALRRRYVQIVSAICALSFLITQVSLLSWCQPAHLNDPQCFTHHNHTIVSLTLSTITTTLVLIIPTPFIPTPRHLLLAILTITGILTLIFGVLAKYSILTAPTSQAYLFYYTSEITLLIIFANLPFLASLVVSTTPARIREFGRNISLSRDGTHMPLSPWPRSARLSVQDTEASPLGTSHWSGIAIVTTGGIDRREWTLSTPVTRPGSVKYGVEPLSRPDKGRSWLLP